jgi:hypothetical protein
VAKDPEERLESIRDIPFGVWRGRESVNIDHGDRENPIRDFPITTGVWAIGAEQRTSVEGSSPR